MGSALLALAAFAGLETRTAVYAVGGVLLLAAFGVGWWGSPVLGHAGDRPGVAG